jgi:CHRD domain
MRQLVLSSLAVALVSCGEQSGGFGRSASTVSLALRADGASLAVFNTTLRAEEEPNGASTSESKGFAQVKVLGDDTIEFTFVINNRGGEVFHRAHIHKAPAGVNGPIHWDFLEAGNPVPSVDGQPAILRGVARARAAANLDDLLTNPSGYYVNVHSIAFPGGAVRGQLQ